MPAKAISGKVISTSTVGCAILSLPSTTFFHNPSPLFDCIETLKKSQRNTSHNIQKSTTGKDEHVKSNYLPITKQSTTTKMTADATAMSPSADNGVVNNKGDVALAPVRAVKNDALFVSEPNPMWFGNGSNDTSNPAWTDKNWLKSRFHFSFAEYRNPKNSSYGVLRVMNDDLVQPHRGFGEHPHADMEIITYIVHGELTHQDSMGTKESLGRGSIQFMTAGSGVQHSEHNHGDKALRFIQSWVVPRRRYLEPNYGSYAMGKECQQQNKNQLVHLVSDVSNKEVKSTPVQVNQDVDVHASELEFGQRIEFDLPQGRQAYLLCIEGQVTVNGKELSKYDACEIHKGGVLDIVASGVESTENGDLAHILMFSMKEVEGSGRSDI